ncbi:hypothetical protein C8R43DRAFT_992182 [Mycena crocata]|nr:hypothetical protein C8R43DRAFT_992182 [Mycena crocata]
MSLSTEPSSSETPPRVSTKEPKNACHYNVSFMQRNFGGSPKRAESLLLPEVENGTLSRRDYDAIMASLPGIPYSTFAGFTISGTGVFLWSRFKRPKMFVGLIGYVVGDLLGEAIRLRTHRTCFRSIQDTNGFARAMDNIKLKVGFNPGPLNFSRPLVFPTDGEEAPFQREADTPYGGELPEPADMVAPTRAPAPEQAQEQAPAAVSQSPVLKSRWDEIRAARRTEPGRSWENIRRGRRPDGTPIPKQSSPSESGSASYPPSYDTERAAAQASFDAMLERERKMSST